jgi:predicted Zn-ribbon and HTH transcriptional regulator
MEMQTKRGKRTLEQIMSERWRCKECGWEGEHRNKVHSRLRGYICPHCFQVNFEQIGDTNGSVE